MLKTSVVAALIVALSALSALSAMSFASGRSTCSGSSRPRAGGHVAHARCR
jgi:hypothetical protein